MLTASTLFVPKALADTVCMPIYGGGSTCTTGSLAIQKNVVNPATNSDVHDLGINDPTFSPGQTVTFHITVTNTGTTTVSSAVVEDTFPEFLTFQNGSGMFNRVNNELTFQISNIAPGQSQTFTITGTVVPASQIPTQNTLCTSNQVSVQENTVSAEDSSQFCIKPTASLSAAVISLAPPQVAASPATGASSLWLGLIPLGAMGYGLIKINKSAKGGKGVHHGN